jgi:hypothetical protein
MQQTFVLLTCLFFRVKYGCFEKSFMSTQSVERINVNFPRPVLDDLRKLVPAKRRSEVIAKATARELRRLKLAALFEALQHNPLWSADVYPQLSDGSAIDTTIVTLRASDTYASAPVEASIDARRKVRRE